MLLAIGLSKSVNKKQCVASQDRKKCSIFILFWKWNVNLNSLKTVKKYFTNIITTKGTKINIKWQCKNAFKQGE